MSYRRFGGVFLVLMVCSWQIQAGKQFQAGAGEQTAADQLILKLQPGAQIQGILSTLPPGISEMLINAEKNLHLLKLPPGLMQQLAPVLAALPSVLYVESNHIRHASIGAPNDPSYGSQWALTTLNAVQAWNLIPGQFLTASAAAGNRIKIAVLDTGIDCTHPDFQNAGGTSANTANGGQIVFSMNRAFVPSTISSTVCSVMDDYGHGTHVAGIIAAATENGTGVASVAWPVSVVSYKVLDNTGSGTDSTIAQAIMAAADAGIPIVSLSLGGAGYSQTLQDAVSYAWAHNTLVIAAAGNSSTNALTFPAGANYAIGVSATDSNNNLASFSNYGNSVDIAAPGVNILSTTPTYSSALGMLNYGSLSGTSMAAPHVSAVAGLIALANPGASAALIAQRLQQSAQSSISGGGWNQSFGYGVVNALAAVSGALRPASPGGITGQVVDGNGLPVAGAAISVPGQSVVTASDGLFRFANLSPGDWVMNGSANGYPAVSQRVAVVAGADTPVALPLVIATGQFTGSVTDRGVPVGGAVVQALSSGAVSGTAITDSAGNYTLPVGAGSYTLQATAMSATGSTTGILSIGFGIVTANLTVAHLGNIAGTVRDGSGNAVAGASILVAGGVTAGASTDSNGNYQTIGLPAGTYTVTAAASGLPTSTVSGVQVSADATTTASLVMGGGTSPPLFAAIRVNAGGGAYTDTAGNTWSADSGFSGGLVWSTGNTISNTTAQPLYQTCRYGNFTYTFPAPNGAYTVVLKFAEVSMNGPGRRLFNAYINGSQVLSNFDIYAQAGGSFIALDKSFTVNVTGGQIALQFSSGSADLPMVNAIQVTQGSSLTQGQNGVFINAGGPAYTDPSGQPWSADVDFSGGATFSVSNSISNTTTPALYQTCRYGDFSYVVPVANGTYEVTLKFAEPSQYGIGHRVFNVAINGSPVLTNFDIYAEAGGVFIALDKSFAVTVTGGQIAIEFTTGPADLPIINAIEIQPGGAPASQPSYFVNAGGPSFTDPTGQVWSADSNYSGGNPWSGTANISNTNAVPLYQTCRYGDFSYSFSAPTGNYNVTLKFAELTQLGVGRRVFNVAINGSPVLSNFDIYAEAGGGLTALDKLIPVTVTAGQITIEFTSGSADLPLVNAIQIVPSQ